MRGFWGKSAKSCAYLQKRKRKRKEFKSRLNAYDYSTSQIEFDPNNPDDQMQHHMQMMETQQQLAAEEEESEYNYYTNSDDDDENDDDNNTEDELQSYYRVKAFRALMLPLSVSAGVGYYLAKK